MIARWAVGPTGAGMDAGILVRLAHEIERHPWWKERARLTLTLLRHAGVRPPASVLDAGCGWGVTLAALERAGYATVGLDASRETLSRLDSPERRLVEADLSAELPADHPVFDAVVALDVIEHADDDAAMVGRMASLARPGACVIVSVPALPDLFSEFDEVQGHRRRYDEERLRRVFAGSALEVSRVFWWGRTFVPVLRWQRRRRRGKPGETAEAVYARYARAPRPPVSWLLGLAAAAETRLSLAGRTTVGTSLFAVARRAG